MTEKTIVIENRLALWIYNLIQPAIYQHFNFYMQRRLESFDLEQRQIMNARAQEVSNFMKTMIDDIAETNKKREEDLSLQRELISAIRELKDAVRDR